MKTSLQTIREEILRIFEEYIKLRNEKGYTSESDLRDMVDKILTYIGAVEKELSSLDDLLKTFPCNDCTEWICVGQTDVCSQIEEIKSWKDDFEKTFREVLGGVKPT
jgi:hypothetical protein